MHPSCSLTGLRSDHTVILTSRASATAYPDPLRRVSYCDPETGKQLKFLTNNFTLPPLAIAEIYKKRWAVELFFRWIKQHLRIKAFYGTSENAVKTQIWIAISVYVLVAIVRKRLGIETSLYQLLQILSVTLFEKTPILRAPQNFDSQDELQSSPNQLILFDYQPESREIDHFLHSSRPIIPVRSVSEQFRDLLSLFASVLNSFYIFLIDSARQAMKWM